MPVEPCLVSVLDKVLYFVSKAEIFPSDCRNEFLNMYFFSS